MPELLTMASHRKDQKRIRAESPLMSPNDPISQATELNCKIIFTCESENMQHDDHNLLFF